MTAAENRRPTSATKIQDRLSHEDLEWLEVFRRDYSDLLQYLHDH